MNAAVAARPKFVARSPVPQYQWKLHCVAVQHKPLLDSVAPLRGPVNHPEAEETTQFRYADVAFDAIEVNRALEFDRFAPIRSGAELTSAKNQAIVFAANFHTARQRQAFAIFASLRQLQNR